MCIYVMQAYCDGVLYHGIVPSLSRAHNSLYSSSYSRQASTSELGLKISANENMLVIK